MDSIKINTGSKRILINDGPEYIEFNPSDVLFAEKFYRLYSEFGAKQKEYEARSKELDAHKDELDINGIPVNIEQGIAFLKEVCEYMRGQIDSLFGSGTSQKVFGDALNIDLFGEFFESITPFVQTARTKKIEQYVVSKRGGRVMK